tara:strand:+ start:4392 stop:4499 length:108 start_codon:yes stop_codon:yes gene_type:complete
MGAKMKDEVSNRKAARPDIEKRARRSRVMRMKAKG